MKKLSQSHPPFIQIPIEIMTESRLKPIQIKVLMAICSWKKANQTLARISSSYIYELKSNP